ncbi:MAG: hypothetical protein ACI9VR_004100, partial [Cognaticolwellia sp.]
MNQTSSAHTWRFTSLGGFTQARMETAADFANLESLDQKLWAALACPVHGLAFDTRTLSLLDQDGDGRIRAPELIAATRWCTAHLSCLDALALGGQALRIDQINESGPEGAMLKASATQILESLGQTDGTLSVADATAASAALAKARFNGDGVVPASASDAPEVQALIGEIIAALGGTPDLCGETGVDQAQVDTFFEHAHAVIAWNSGATPELLVLGDDTPAATDALLEVRAKVNDYFARCRLAAFDPRALAALNRTEEEYLAIASQDLSVSAEEVTGFPLSRVGESNTLPLLGAVNPAWADRLETLLNLAVRPLLGADRESIEESDWKEIQAKLLPFDSWRGTKPASAVNELSHARLEALVAGGLRAQLSALIARDLAQSEAVNGASQVERLVRYHHDLYELAQNFVNMTHFYSDTERATFEAGTLYLDERACELVVRVRDAKKHAAMAGRSKLFLAYCTCTRPKGQTMEIAAAFTDGDTDFLIVGRNGVFYDRDGKDWDATITKIVDNPVSLREAFWQPYKRIVTLLEERAAKTAEARSAERDRANQDLGAKLTKQAESHLENAKTPSATTTELQEPKIDVGTVAAIAVGLGALGSLALAVLGYLTGLFSLPFWIICLVLLTLFVAISAPSVILAWFKLRQRSLGAILDSNGWAVNGQARISVRFGRTMTLLSRLPPGAVVDSKDKYADPRNPLPRFALVLIALAFVYSLLNFYGSVHQLSGGRLGQQASTLTDFAAEMQEISEPLQT